MPISLPNIFHDFQKKTKNNKKTTKQTHHTALKTMSHFLYIRWNWKAKKSDFPFFSLTNRSHAVGSFWSHDIQTPLHTHKKQAKER